MGSFPPQSRSDRGREVCRGDAEFRLDVLWTVADQNQVLGDGSLGNAVPLSDERDTCSTLLSRTFGLGDQDD